MKKKVILLVSLIILILFLPHTVFAQEKVDLKKTNPEVAKTAILAACIGMVIASAVCSIGQAKVASSACEGIARNPSAAGDIRGSLILGLIFIESLALYTLAVIFLVAR